MSWPAWLSGALALVILNLIYLGWYLRWEREHTAGMAYFGKPSTQRALVKKRIRAYSMPVLPIVRLVGLFSRRASMPAFRYQGICGPPLVCSPESFARAAQYQPRPDDVFVASQMRSGTTWMLQLVYEVASRGNGNLGDDGHVQLHAVCPWIEALNGVPLEEAPRVGARRTRIIKTHLPTTLCPFSENAKYVYVARDPASCFVSVMRYIRTLSGPLAPAAETLVEWYCSDEMYWSPWPRHVTGWRNWAQSHGNVLYLLYEDMTADLPTVVDRVAGFLGYDLTSQERQRVIEKCRFSYMKEHEDRFEMAPPTMFSVAGGEFLTGPTGSKEQELTPAMRERILDYCRPALATTAPH